MSIPLPPLPRMTHYGGTATVVSPEWLRARDQEIVRVVREAAAKIAHQFAGEHAASVIRALEFKHVE